MTPRPDVAEAAEDAPVAATAAVAANPATTEARVGAKQQLLAACQAAEHWLRAELDRPAESRRNPRATRRPGQPRQSRQGPRDSSKEALVIEMLCRPQGATIAQIMA